MTTMNKDQLRELLHQEYKTENWKRVTEFVFPNVQYLQRPQAIPFSNDKVESFKQIGNVKLTDGKNLAMFEVRVAQNVNLARNRVELRKLVEKLIDQERNHGVLVIYEQGKEDYRFTFTAKSTEFDEEENDFVDHETDAKRFTYILGKNESCKTAANRFWELSTHKDTATIKDVEAAFSVERLNKEFFNKYKAFYEDFVQYITGKRFVKEKGKWVEKKLGRARPIHKEVFDSDDKMARNFVKLLLGRLVFIQFLQKKGWMGVLASSKKWEKGDPEFLFNFYNNAKNKEEFHSKYLYPLFYKAFNSPDRSNDVFPLTGSRVPYLNGGLFENDNLETKNIDFPATYFGNLLDFFGQYNFTIDENDPQDHEVGIDPEMLGHIFENLLEDNKDKGAFYTPKPIVQYMCQESLIQYLKTFLQEKQIWPKQEDAAAQTETHIQNFVRKKIAGDLLNDYDKHLAEALKEVKICDPAIGSGAFPMGLLNEIFYCMHVLYYASPDTVGAVWKMEEWAPDLVKKNIIQNSIYGVDIEKGAVDIARLRFWLSLIVNENEPYPLPNLDYKIVVGDSLSKIERDLFSDVYFTELEELKPKYFECSNPEVKKKIKSRIDILFRHITRGNKDFDFEVYFSDVFHTHKGFDIVIGNPPYGAKLNDHQKKIYRLQFPETQFKIDSYSLFLLKSLDLLKANASCHYIIPNTLLDNYFEEKVREKLLSKNTILEIIDLSDSIFEAAVVHSMIFSFQKSQRKEYFIRIGIDNKLIGKTINIPMSYFLEQDKYIFNINNYSHRDLLKKLTQNSILLENILDIRQTIKTGDDEKFIYTEKLRKNYKPILRGKDITKWTIIFQGLFVDYGNYLACPRDHRIFEQPKILIREAGNKITATFDDNDYYIMSSLYNGILIDKKFELKYLLALINSKLFQYQMNLLTFEKTKGAFTKARIFHYYKLPIKNIDINIQRIFIQLVDKILSKRKNNFDSDISEIESEIDIKIYKLYDLTYDEVLIIDPE